MRQRGLAFALLATVVVGCSTIPTRIRLIVDYESSWPVTELEVVLATSSARISRRVPLSREVLVVVPDAWSEQTTTVAIRAMARGSKYAAGDTIVTPRSGREVSVRVALTRIPCGAWCEEGATMCDGNAVASCAQRDEDECMEWGEPRVCEGATTCSHGVCSGTCVDECHADEVSCAGPNARRACGERGDGDACRDWLPIEPCSTGTFCSLGTCRSSCVDECVRGARRCAGRDVERCGDFNDDGCAEWGPRVPGSCETSELDAGMDAFWPDGSRLDTHAGDVGGPDAPAGDASDAPDVADTRGDRGVIDVGADLGLDDASPDFGLDDASVDLGVRDTGADLGTPDAGMRDTGADARVSDAGVDLGVPDAGVRPGILVDGSGRVGGFVSHAIDSSGTSHVSYWERVGGNLRYATWRPGDVVRTEAVDTAGDTGGHNSITASTGLVRISYYDFTQRALRYAAGSAGSWTLRTIDNSGDVGTYSSLRDVGGVAHIAYADWGNGVRYARGGVSWTTHVVDSSRVAGGVALLNASEGFAQVIHLGESPVEDFRIGSGSFGGALWTNVVYSFGAPSRFTDVAVDRTLPFDGAQPIAVIADGSVWVMTGDIDDRTIRMVDGDTHVAGVALAVDASGRLHVAHRSSRDELIYSLVTSTTVTREVVDGSRDLGSGIAIALDPAGEPRIAYFVIGDGTLRLTRRTSGAWR